MGSNSRLAGLVVGAALLIAHGAWQGQTNAAEAAVTVPCTTSSLISAIRTANTAGSPQTLNLAASCTYNLTTAADTGTRGGDGLPIITGYITLVGSSTTIQRMSSALFRIAEVTGTLFAQGITFRDGDAGDNPGGGILSSHGVVSLTSTTIRSNAADNGAGVANDNGRFTITSSVITNNTTVTTSGGGGAGAYNDGIMRLVSTAVTFNNANTSGGGVYNELTGSLAVTGSQLQANTANLQGGGLYNGTNGAVTFTSNSTVQLNTANSTGGGIYSNACQCSITLTDTTISANNPNNCRPTGWVVGCTG
jgi:hypothetical protein